MKQALSDVDETVWLQQEQTADLLRAYGLKVAETLVAHSAGEAAAAAERIGYPVVLKLRSSTIVHKSDIGGVVLGLRTAREVEDAYTAMMVLLETRGLLAQAEGVVVQPMLGGGQEVIVGMSQDPVFGPLVMLGLGGVQVELIKDVAFSLHPLTDLDPDRMLKQLKSTPLLTGWRGSTPKDVPALKDALLRFSAMIEDNPEIDTVELNPVMVMDEGRGCVAVDARARLRRR